MDEYLNHMSESVLMLVSQLMQSHGRIEEIIELSKKKADYDTIVMHYINEEDFASAIKYIEELDKKDE